MNSDDVFDIFREEAREHLGALEKSFLDLETADDSDKRRSLIDSAFRHAHSLKSDAKVVGLSELKKAAQELEDVLDEMRDNPDSVDRETIDWGLIQFDHVRSAFENGGIGEMQETTTESSELPETAPAADRPSSGERVAAQSAIVSRQAEMEERFTVRVPSDRLDRMLNLAGELRISQRADDVIASRLAAFYERVEQLKHDTIHEQGDRRAAIDNLLDYMRRIDRDLRKKRGREELLVESLEENIRQARLLPIVMLTDSLRRTARDLSQSLGKSIAYRADVGSIMLDKAVIEALKDPMTHLIRNAADHGIESGDERTSAGKPEEGTIAISASRKGQYVRITVADDGRGVDFSRVREKVVRSGDLDRSGVAQLSERQLADYLFRPGFSTAQTGDVSGRGVGLDVVLDAVRRLQGSAELESSSPSGTTFAITVPVTVSTVRILTVLAAGQRYGIPSSAVVGTGRANRNDLRELEGNLILPVNGRPVRWVHLTALLGGESQLRARNGNASTLTYVLVSSENREMAVAVDDIEDELEVLLKPLGYPLTGLPGLVGATIGPDGSVQMVLDPSDRTFAKTRATTVRPDFQTKPAGRILVVDDSPTTRAVLRNVFSAAGYAVSTATDGVDALEHLAERPVDVVISDVEMPRLNGFDLARQVKSRFALPVILVTGREKEEHRREGLEAGADAYVVKSTFDDRGLLEIVEQFV